MNFHDFGNMAVAQMEVDLLKIPQLAFCLLSVHPIPLVLQRIHVHLHEN